MAKQAPRQKPSADPTHSYRNLLCNSRPITSFQHEAACRGNRIFNRSTPETALLESRPAPHDPLHFAPLSMSEQGCRILLHSKSIRENRKLEIVLR